LSCLYDLDASKARELAARLGDCAVANDFESMLDEVDVMAIASFDDAHCEQVIAALRAGKHVFVEKPICRTIAELRSIKSAWQGSGGRLKLRSNLVLRAAPMYRWLKDRIDSNELGQLYAFDGDYLYGRLHKITDGWRGKVSEYSVMEGGGIHMVDLMLWLSGERPTTVTASGNRISTRNTEFRYNDFSAATFDFSSGLIGRITANYGCVHKHHHVMRVFGTNATFLYDDQGPRCHKSRDPFVKEERIAQAPLPANKGDLIPDFVAAIANDIDDRAETQSYFDGISVCIAADRASATGNRERIEYV
jgi:predicted dehydrogenase